MTDGLTQNGNEMISGEVANESLVGQAASAVEVAAPAAGETTNVVLTKGQTATLNFDAAAATPVLEGNDFVLTFDTNGDGSADSRIVFQNLVQESQGSDAPVLVIGGIELSAGLLIGQAQALVDGDTLETAAGAGAGATGGGGSTYDENLGDVIDLLNAQGVIEGTLAGSAAEAEGEAGTFDDAPTALPNDPALADDGELSEGNLGGVGDDESVNLTGTLGHDFGDDGAGSLLLTGAELPDGFTSAVTDGGLTLTISQDGVEVVKVTLADPTSGGYEVELLSAIKHPEGDDENNVDFTIEYRVTDSDGDFADGTLNLSVDDDTPVATDAVIDGGTVHEDVLPDGNSEPDVQSLTAEGSVAGLFSIGADGPGTYSFINSETQITEEVVTVAGSNQPGSVQYVTFTLTEPSAVTISTDGPTIDPEIFLLEDDGSLDLDNILANDDDDGTPAGSFSNSIINYGDEITILPAGTYVVAVSDFALSENEAVSGINDTSSIGERTGDVTVTVTAHDAFADLPQLTSGGEPVTYSIDGNVLTASADGDTVFTLELNPNTGGYDFTLVGQVDHLPNDPANDDSQVLELDFGPLFVATDGDGDTVDATGSLIIKIEDDVPVVANEEADLIKEKRLDDTDPNNSTVNGTLDIDFGADGGTVTGIEFKGWTDTEDNDPSGTTLTSGGVAVIFASTIVNGELVYTGSVGTAEIIKVVIDQETGEYSITQLGPIDHPDVSYDSENDGPTNSNDNDPITLSFDYTVTDGDGDTATAELSVVIEDDEVDSRSVFADDSIFIDEATLVDGVDDNSVISGTLELGLGADGGSVTNVWFNSWEDSEDGNPDGQTLTSGGNPVVFADAVEDGSGNWVLVGKVGTQEIVTVTIDKLTGEYSIELQGPIDNPDHGSANSNPWDPVTLSFRYETIDGDGDQDISTLEIIIEDDQSVANADTNSGDAVKEDDDLIAEGNVLDNDTIGADGAVVTTTDEMTGTYGSVTIDADGAYTYNLNNGADNVQSLAQDETVTETFTYEIEDADGDTSTATLEISVTGTNDAPVIGGLNGEYYGVNGQISNLAQFRGIVEGNDPDATFTASEISYSIGRGTVSRGDNLQKFLGDDADTLSTDPGNTSDGGLHMFGQVYLAAGTYQFQVRADDGFQIKIDGASVSEYANNQGPTTRTGVEFTITEDGYYDVDMVWWDQGGAYVFEPALSFNGGAFETFTPDNFDFQLDAGSTVIEAGNLDDGTVVDGTDTVTGSMVATDVDNGAVLTWSSETAGTYGTFGIDPITGAWTYVLNNGDADTDALAEGQSETETFTVTVTDEFGATDTQDVTITVKGTNDSPIAVADTDVSVAAGTELVTDAAPAQLTNFNENSTSDYDFGSENAGKLVSIEFDFQAVGSWDANGGNQDDFIVTINGVEVLFTHDGGSIHYTFEVTTDSDGKVAIEFNAVVTGDNEGADITNLVISTVGDDWVETLKTDENSSLTVDVLANDTDVDNGAVLTLDTVSFASAMTTASVNVVGNELVFNPGTDFDYLAEGATAEVVVNYTISDEHGAVSSSTSTIIVTGSNDAPVLEALTLLTNNAENFSFEGDLLAHYSSDAEGDDVVISPANVDVASGDVDFAYTGSDGDDSTNGTVGVTRVDDLTVTGTDADEILVGRDIVSADAVDLSVDEDFSNVSEWTVLGNTTSVNGGEDSRLNTSNSVVSAAVFAAAVGVTVGDLNAAVDNGVGSGEDLTSGSALYRDFTVAAGQTLTLDFNFINQESGGTTWDDSSVIVIGDEVFLLSQSSNIDADGIFTYTFTDSGPVTVGIAVFNETDTIEDSSLIVENLSLSNAEIPAVLGDILEGGAGDDTLMGLAGDDFLAGGAGDDVMIGGTGSDTFIFSAEDLNGTDTIQDFNTGQGDVLDLEALLADDGSLAGAGNSDELATALESYLDISSDGTNTTIVVDRDGGEAGTDVATITLQNIDLTSGGSISEHDAIQTLLDNNNLVID